MEPVTLTSNSRVEGSHFLKNFKFKEGNVVPLYEVEKMSAFNQLIGHAKFVNAQYGNVYYRGVDGLYDTVLPSVMRRRRFGNAKDLNQLLNKICDDDYFHDSLKLRDVPQKKDDETYYLSNEIKRKNKHCVEGLLQHYAGNTRFLDVVDNHWVALWMGLHCFVKGGKGFRYCRCEKRELSLGDIYQLSDSTLNTRFLGKNIYEYILLLAMPYAESNPKCGIVETKEFVEVDLRKVLPSIYLRPHAQHALVIRRRDVTPNTTKVSASYYDLASQVIAIFRVRIDKASLWLGNGNLLTASNLFPSPSVDQGYNSLLMHSNLFIHPFEIIKYF
jgi:hypothetical protein